MSLSQSFQLPLFDAATPEERSDDLGTFKDSMRAPIHAWFRYPAGYSYRFVEATFDEYAVKGDDWVYDPFSGTGTTLICAKQRGVNAYGVEAHAFVHWVANVKLYWEFDFPALQRELSRLMQQADHFLSAHLSNLDPAGIFPDLVYKCYHPRDLKELYALREFILNHVSDVAIQNLMKLALTASLRSAAAAGTGWPYIAPNKNTGDKPPKNAIAVFKETLWRMYSDLFVVAGRSRPCEIHNIRGDSREKQALADGQVRLALTSPPYLNNYDYADRTRLETYFWGITKSWKDITSQFRDKLIIAATTQIVRSQYYVETALSKEIQQIAPQVYQTIQHAILELSRRRLDKGGKKDYDLMVALYFNDMIPVIRETYRVLSPREHFCLVLGDSAPYGVHIQTDNLIGQLGLAIGFKKFEYREFRTRGGKWKENPQRHSAPLREGVIVLTK